MAKSSKSQETTNRITNTLSEPNSDIIGRVVTSFGREESLKMCREAQQIHGEHNTLIHDGSRQKTMGGIFLQLAKKASNPTEQEAIFPGQVHWGHEQGCAPPEEPPPSEEAPQLVEPTWAARVAPAPPVPEVPKELLAPPPPTQQTAYAAPVMMHDPYPTSTYQQQQQGYAMENSGAQPHQPWAPPPYDGGAMGGTMSAWHAHESTASRGRGQGGGAGREKRGNKPRAICKFHEEGHCRNGQRCKFSHDNGGVEEVDPYQLTQPTTEPFALATILGQAAAMARHQKGSRVLQNALGEQPSGEYAVIDLIFAELLEHCPHLFIDPYGNYVCQKLIKRCRPVQLLAIVDSVQADLVDLSMDPHGTRAVQCLIQTLGTDLSHLKNVLTVTGALCKNPSGLIRSAHGNHVIQACLASFTCEANQFIYDDVLSNFVSTANNRHGCCVLQRCLRSGSFEQVTSLLQAVCINALPLVRDAYGNYVVQFVLKQGDPVLYEEVFKQLACHIELLSMQKFSSNVIEKGLRWEPAFFNTTTIIIAELAAITNIKPLLHSPYGNYVLQKALAVPHPATLQLAHAILPVLPEVQSVSYGKKMERLVNTVFEMHAANHSPGQLVPSVVVPPPTSLEGPIAILSHFGYPIVGQIGSTFHG